MKILTSAISILLALSPYGVATQPDVPSQQITNIKADFQNPPADTRPGCYWYWINDNVSKKGITKDLEAMARVGIGRAYIGHIYNHDPDVPSRATPVGKVKFMSDAWWDAVQWAVKEADRCGVEIGFFNSSGWSQSGGPWVKPSQSMRYLIHSETTITGGSAINQIIPVPEIITFPMSGGSRPVPTGPKFTVKDYQDVRVVAFRQPDTEANDLDMKQVNATSGNLKDVRNLVDSNAATSSSFEPQKEIIVDLTLPETPATKTGIQSLRLTPLDIRYTLHCQIESSADGRTYQPIGNYSEERGHQGGKKLEPLMIPFQETQAKHLRLTFRVTGKARFSELALSRQAALGGYVRKQLGETSPSVTPAWDAYVWQPQIQAATGSTVAAKDVIDLTEKMDTDGRLKWNAPAGQWVVLRIGMIPMGTQCAPSSPLGRGLEVDKMNKAHVADHFNGMVGEFLRRTPAKDRKALKYVIADSYETGPQNWTDGFARKFKSRFGYAPEKYLPVLTGRVVDSPEVSDRFLWDMRRLIVEGIAYDYVGGLREVCNQNDLTLWLENYGHWGFPSEFLLYGSQTNQVGGEFWVGGVRDNIECRAASSCGRTYGKRSIYAESFTSSHNFKSHPASLKKFCDWLYGTGVNHLIFHVNIHQPEETKPGIIQWFGTAINRHNTWFEQFKGFADYTRRSAVLLKSGLPVIDVAYYIGENAPMMTGPRNPELPDGYDFDFINSDVLINRASVKKGKIVVQDGPSYAVLVLPNQTIMRPEVSAAIKRLVSQGATVVGPKPSVSPSLQNYPQCDQAVTQIANEVWGEIDGETVKYAKFGQGMVYNGVSLDHVLAKTQLQPDVQVTSESQLTCAAAGAGLLGVGGHGGIVFQHRTGDNTEIYFLANTMRTPADFTVSLRCAGLKPTLWNAVTGTIAEEIAFSQKDGRTHIPLHLEGSESVFVVLKGEIKPDARGSISSNTPDYKKLSTLDGPWQVSFNGQAAPGEIVFEQLTDWTRHSNQAIQHYSGTAVYQKSFTLNKATQGKSLVLELGDVANVATVFLNGKEVGTVWTSPWEIDITRFAVAGKNNLQINITNTWNNRLVADAALPKEKRQSHVSQPYRFNPKSKPSKSGLLGPVKIKQKE